MTSSPHPAQKRAFREWDGFPFVVLGAYMVVGSILLPLLRGSANLIGAIVLSLIGVGILVWIWRWPHRPGAPRRPLARTEGITQVPAVVGEFRSGTTLDGSVRVLGAIAAAHAWRGNEADAILVPGITRGVRRKLWVAVQIEGNGRAYTVGYLPETLALDWVALLEPDAAHGIFHRVPVRIISREKYTVAVDVDLHEVTAALDTAGINPK